MKKPLDTLLCLFTHTLSSVFAYRASLSDCVVVKDVYRDGIKLNEEHPL